MNTQTHPTTTRTSLTRVAVTAAVAGVIASLVMAAYAMLAALTYQDSGFFTPLHHIASVFTSPGNMMASMESAMAGSSFKLFVGPALLGALIHMMTGALYGAAFGVLAGLARLHGVVLVVAATVWGFLVFAFSAFVGLPVAAELFDSGDQIADMVEMVGYGTFVVEHLIFGLVLGLVLAMWRRGDRAH